MFELWKDSANKLFHELVNTTLPVPAPFQLCNEYMAQCVTAIERELHKQVAQQVRQ